MSYLTLFLLLTIFILLPFFLGMFMHNQYNDILDSSDESQAIICHLIEVNREWLRHI